ELLRIAAGKGIEPFGNRARAHRILPYHAADARLDSVPAQERPPEYLAVGGNRSGSGNGVFGQGQAGCAALRKAVGRQMRKPLPAPACSVGAQHVHAVEADRAAGRFRKAGKHGYEAALAAAIDTSNADDLTRADGQVYILDAVCRIRGF